MLTNLGVVQVHPRSAGPQWPRWLASVARRRFGGKSLLEWVVRRVTDAQRLDGVIVVLSDDPVQRSLAELVPPDVPVFVSDEPDPLARLVAAAEKYRAEGIVQMGIDHPFIDPVLIDRLVVTAQRQTQCDYIGCCSNCGDTAMLAKLGIFAEWCRVKALRRADRKASDSEDRNDPTHYVYSRPDQFRLRFVPVPPELDRQDLRLVIGGEEDWDHAQTIFEALGPEGLDWQQIAGLLDRHPAIRERMEVLNRDDVRV